MAVHHGTITIIILGSGSLRNPKTVSNNEMDTEYIKAKVYVSGPSKH